jgi:carbon-monoxide dehydrogenase large subunit
VHGGVVQGIGQALFELADYDAEGQLLSGSLVDYALPKIDQVCQIDSHFFETPSPTNPLGAKGIGEAGACAAPPLIVAAVCDALSPFGISHLDMPLTAPRIWRAIQKSRERENA